MKPSLGNRIGLRRAVGARDGLCLLLLPVAAALICNPSLAAPQTPAGAAATANNNAKLHAAAAQFAARQQLTPAQKQQLAKTMAAAKGASPAQKAAMAKALASSPALTPAQKAALAKRAAALGAKGVGGSKPGNPFAIQVAAMPVGPHDPFKPAVNVKKLKVASPQVPVTQFVPVENLARLPGLRGHRGGQGGGGVLVPTQEQIVPLGRVAGIILSNGVRAIYEFNGNSSILQPGDPLPGANGRVQSIQPDGMTVRLAGNKTVRLPVTAGDTNNNNQNAPGGFPNPESGYNPGGMPPGFGPGGGDQGI